MTIDRDDELFEIAHRPMRRSIEGFEDFRWYGACEGDAVTSLKGDILRHVVSSFGRDYERTSPYIIMRALSMAVRDRLIEYWIRAQRDYYDKDVKRVYYLSLEYLPGRSLKNNLHCLGIYDEAKQAMEGWGLDIEELAELEWDAGLGNGGLGRLASCYLDSMAALNIPGYGYGIRYDYGIFYQVIENGHQVERSDNWMRHGNLWEFERHDLLFEVKFYGHVHQYTDSEGRLRHELRDTQNVMAQGADMLVPGYLNNRAVNMRLWAATSSREFDLGFFNAGDYIRAVQDRIKSENISKVLYPNDEKEEGRELRLRQQYFFVAATIRDIMRRFYKRCDDLRQLPDKVAIQLNETHPAVGVPELMRLLVDEELVPWDLAWDVCRHTFAYTNHTILPEALETWPMGTFGRVLPRHMQIVEEINRRFMNEIELRSGAGGEDTAAKKERMSILGEGYGPEVRMANLAIYGSHTVNGVSALHSNLIKEGIFKDFAAFYPERFQNKTNGVTPRRWLLSCNRPLAELITEKIGKGWVCDLTHLRRLEEFVDDKAFRKAWRQAKLVNKERLVRYVARKLDQDVDPKSLFDVHIKRIHEYKRQVMNLLHVITLYNRLKAGGHAETLPRSVFFAGKAAPGYRMAKLIIEAILAVADKVNRDPTAHGYLKVYFLPNYCVSQAEKVIPATDISEQISTAGMEASGTGNMKFSLNGAIIMGALDGANIEMADEMGRENMFIFGKTAEELAAMKGSYNPRAYYESDPELKQALDMLADGAFSPHEPWRFRQLTDALLDSDNFFVLADYRAFVDKQEEAAHVYRDQEEWTRRSIYNTARMGFFSSDRAVAEYARDIWRVKPI